MEAEPIGAGFGEDAGVAGADVAAVGFGKECAAALKHIFAVPGQIGTSGGWTSANPHVVGAADAAAALTPVDEKVVIIVVLIEAGGFDGIIPGDGGDGRVCLEPLPGCGIELHDFDAGPVGAEGEPKPALIVGGDAGVDGIEAVFATGLDNDAVIGPAVLCAGGVERFAGGEANGRGL